MVQKVFQCQYRAIKRELDAGVVVINTGAPWWQKMRTIFNPPQKKRSVAVQFGA